MSAAGAGGGRVEVAWGPRAAEASLVDSLLAAAESLRSDPVRLALPLRVVVPSRSLRLHIAARVVERAGSAVVGLRIQTLSGLALEILDRAGEVAPASDVLPLVVREQARAEARLSEPLDFLADGYGAVEAAVVDLLDAGFEPVHAEAAQERLGEFQSQGLSVDLGCAVIRVAARSVAVLRENRVGHRSDLLARATDLLEDDPERLPARGVFVHGFSDATGRATELILALLRHRSAVVILDTPPEPAALLAGSAEAPPGIFVDRFYERLSGFAPVVESNAAPPPPPQVCSFSAVGGDGEAREVAQRIQVLLRGGARPETIGVVARDRAPYLAWLRVHFERLGVPYSGLAPVDLGGSLSRRFAALGAVVRGRERCQTDRWLDARADMEPSKAAGIPGFGEVERADLRVGFRHQGAGRLAQAAALPAFPQGMILPVRRGRAIEARAASEAPELQRRSVPAEVVAAALAAAKQLHVRLCDWPLRASITDYAARLQRLAEEDLAWSHDEALLRGLGSVLDRMRDGGLAQQEVAFEDFANFVERRLATVAERGLGGEGAGVQVLSVMEARARTFDHLFVLGLNRDVFPRGVREDALFPDSLREALADLLPDMPIKRRGYEEERHLFAQLLASSLHVTLSWQHANDEGRSRAASTLLERLRWAQSDFEGRPEPGGDVSSDAWLPASEHAFEAALAGGTRGLAPLLPEVCEERARWAGGKELASGAVLVAAGELSASRLAVLREWDRAPIAGAGLGPYFGFVGSPTRAGDPRKAAVWITRLEDIAACPWQSFLRRTLGVEAPRDPLGELPEVGALLTGSLVHRVLERLAREALAGGGTMENGSASLADLRSRTPVAWQWPGDEHVVRCLQNEAPRLLAAEGMALAGLESVLWRRAWIRLQVFRDLEWPGPDSSVSLVGAEVEGAVQVSGETVRFRADRVDLQDGALVLTDYKTGRPFSAAAREDTRRKHFLQKVGQGELLQGVAYALAAGEEGDLGRYLYLAPETERESLEVLAPASDPELASTFERVLAGLLELREAGSFVPRLLDAKGDNEPRSCGFCEVSAACVRGDSGARRRLHEWLEDGAPGTRAEQSVRSVWDLWRQFASAGTGQASSGGGS